MVAKRVPLFEGFFLVDEEDFERVSGFNWRISKDGYVIHGRNNDSVHRMLMGCERHDGKLVDHRDGDPLNNQRYNLRVTDARGNATNVTSSSKQKAGGYKGVHWNKRAKKWQASICAGEVKANGKRRQLYLGVFEDPIAAARAYDAEAIKHFGEFASLNFP